MDAKFRHFHIAHLISRNFWKKWTLFFSCWFDEKKTFLFSWRKWIFRYFDETLVFWRDFSLFQSSLNWFVNRSDLFSTNHLSLERWTFLMIFCHGRKSTNRLQLHSTFVYFRQTHCFKVKTFQNFPFYHFKWIYNRIGMNEFGTFLFHFNCV